MDSFIETKTSLGPYSLVWGSGCVERLKPENLESADAPAKLAISTSPAQLKFLEQAIAARQLTSGLVHHSDRGVQYASDEYVRVLQAHQMIPSMSRPANPYDNASCGSFMKTLKREEIYANDYVDLDHLRRNIEVFIEQYYNRCRLHSALGYKPPDEFEQQLRPA